MVKFKSIAHFSCIDAGKRKVVGEIGFHSTWQSDKTCVYEYICLLFCRSMIHVYFPSENWYV
jgi:hypothetical protein